MTASPLVVTGGDPAGIGPDLCIAAAADPSLPDFVVISDADMLAARVELLGAGVTISRVDADRPGRTATGELRVVHRPFPAPVECGRPDPANATALLDGLRDAVDGCRAGRFRALVTGPLSKRTIIEAGIPFSGHTEFLAAETGGSRPVMLLVAGDLRVALATTHLPLRDVPDALTRDGLRQVLSILHSDLEIRFGVKAPRILVCGLNPHAGEGGHLGREDEDVIRPVVDALRAGGMDCVGPIPADTAFTPAAGRHDAVVAMYHDQGLPVLKHSGFGHAVNVTLGLPIIRTSVDHGTAFDLAGTGRADTGSLKAALGLAAALAART